ncbi:hypothetical protein VV01_00025 [Luteipulveratus halotolerans]|uniref:Uncharacterized protein n=1 Tax=Luteipulveratus halotolerans TaxID=1631356 RepID=A0A0L6CQ51_9MICO|nr:hypothetical protein VV01_00025 [Luteipulveratus halotolerans]
MVFSRSLTSRCSSASPGQIGCPGDPGEQVTLDGQLPDVPARAAELVLAECAEIVVDGERAPVGEHAQAPFDAHVVVLAVPDSAHVVEPPRRVRHPQVVLEQQPQPLLERLACLLASPGSGPVHVAGLLGRGHLLGRGLRLGRRLGLLVPSGVELPLRLREMAGSGVLGLSGGEQSHRAIRCLRLAQCPFGYGDSLATLGSLATQGLDLQRRGRTGDPLVRAQAHEVRQPLAPLLLVDGRELGR